MENTNFWNGFTKVAVYEHTIPAGVSIGAAIGGALAARKNIKWIEENMLGKQKGSVDARKMFEEIKKHLPKNTVLLTNSDLHKKVKSSKTVGAMRLFQELRAASEGNAAAVPEVFIDKEVKKNLPSDLHGKNIIISDDKIHPAVFAHEAGHVIDFHDIKNSSLLNRVAKKFRGTVSEELAAWDKAPNKDKIEGFSEKREGALNTYKRGRNYPLIGSVLGGGLGFLLPYLMQKHAGSFKDMMIELEDKKRKEQKKTIPVEEA